MPLYEYCCKKCGHRQEEFRTIENRRTAAICDECGSLASLCVSGMKTVHHTWNYNYKPAEWVGNREPQDAMPVTCNGKAYR